MAKFTEYVALVDPSMKPVAFAPGDEVPDWATVGDHVTDGASEPKRPGRPRKEEPKDEQQA